ncbi:NAD(P)-binding domain-containing protein [Nocardioides zeae]|uniref:NAD(P)-binding domain-containing protein n=1 Tax=Nocardioides imazamoxiresistens TaxID=3231893 RepID=A0ABU3PZ99_9ACTN|nr:NAD(P)-binding domain-containing protein [Nocardioides zeae]MDT9594593.1 NAD(P)-binding domain-containing protein [Nocardioides zeae]
MDGVGDATVWDAVVVGAGQAGLSASFHLRRLGLRHVVLDAATAPGGAWQHRSHSLTMADVHGVADLPDLAAPPADPATAARTAVPAYFAAYEQRYDLPVLRPVDVDRVEEGPERLLVVHARDGRTWTARTLVNATGTWRRPFVPHVTGAEDFAGLSLHSSRYDGPEAYAGRTVLVVGGGASAVQVLGELAPVTSTLWATRRPPLWRDPDSEPFDGRAAVALVEERVRRGLPPASVVSVTGLHLRPQEQRARELGAYASRLPMPRRLVADGGVWPDGTHRAFDVVLWATGFRPDVAHLAPLGLRAPGGGIALDGTSAVADPRVQLVGYGPSASTIGANRAGRQAALAVRRVVGGHVLTSARP